ncbi:MAG: asparaginase [Propionibacteriaceae bacterium]|nr:asparaginase [Propionibacteriaceae bacterium]
MRRVDLLATGGAIASRARAAGGAVATDRGDDLLGRVAVPSGVEVTSRDVLRLNSFAMTPRDMQVVLDAVLISLGSADVDGVVVTHGTDTMEETAFLVDLFLSDERPVVFTGAQRSADAADSDGPRNLRDAVAVAAAETSRRLGTLIVFDRTVFPARGTRKSHTIAPASFSCPDAGPVGGLVDDVPWISARPDRGSPLDPARLRIDDLRVDIVAVYPGCDATAMEAAVGAGARGVVLEATGAGNANPTICDAVRRLTAQGVVVLLSTRVHAGPVVPLYSGGGGTDLVHAGALPTGLLRPSQARMLLIALLGTQASREDVSAALSS